MAILAFVAMLFAFTPGCVVQPVETGKNGDSKPPRNQSASPSASPSVRSTSSPTPSPALSNGIPVATPTPDMIDPSTSEPLLSAPVPPNMPELEIPVSGIKRKDLRDTFTDDRSEGRVHGALDIMAPKGTAVVAAADGKILRLFSSAKGGLTIYQANPDGTIVFYYAHLDRYADNVIDGQKVRKGETIGYVGDTGNAGAGNFHLHFAIWIPVDPKRYWEGVNINPYPLLKEAGEKR